MKIKKLGNYIGRAEILNHTDKIPPSESKSEKAEG